MAKAGRRSKGKVQLRIAKDLADWLAEHARENKDGFTSRALVAEEAIRRYRDSRTAAPSAAPPLSASSAPADAAPPPAV